MIPEDKEKATAVNKLGPNASCLGSTWKRVEHVKVDSDAIELIVPPAQPIRCACISNAGWILNWTDDNMDNAIVLVTIGCIPINDNIVITKGVRIKKDQEGRIEK